MTYHCVLFVCCFVYWAKHCRTSRPLHTVLAELHGLRMQAI